jgi:hypothetical protein
MDARIPLLALAIVCWFALCGTAAAQGTETAEAALAKQIQNPLANLITLPLQANFNNGVGPDDRTFFNLNVQPVIPFPGEKWNVISRTIIPVNSVPLGETDSVFGIGDTNLSLFWSPAEARQLTWGIGPAITLPTASNPEVLGSGKLSVGPTGVLFYKTGEWTMGFVASNTWSVAGDGDREDVNFFFAQYFANYNFGHGWALGTAPIVTVNWEADSDNTWTIPWGLQVSKLTRFGARPVNLLIGYYKNSEHPSGSADEQVRLQVNFLFPKQAR